MTYKEIEAEIVRQRARLAELINLQNVNADERRTQMMRLDSSYELTIAAGNELLRLRKMLETKIAKLQTEYNVSKEHSIFEKALKAVGL